MATYVLEDMATGKRSEHPNRNGARLSSLFHVKNKETVWWRTNEGPAQVATDYGRVGDVDRFRIYLYE